MNARIIYVLICITCDILLQNWHESFSCHDTINIVSILQDNALL